MSYTIENPMPLVILISGNGSNLQAILDAIAAKELSARICAVISNRADAYGLQRAHNAGIPTHVIIASDFSDREAYDHALQNCIEQYHPALIVLAGFMRILTPSFVKHFAGKIINIHPSLLPNYPGLNTHARVLQAGDKEHGVTIHWVTEDLDAGPVIAQEKISITGNETIATLEEKIHQLEHRLYPATLQRLANSFK